MLKIKMYYSENNENCEIKLWKMEKYSNYITIVILYIAHIVLQNC